MTCSIEGYQILSLTAQEMILYVRLVWKAHGLLQSSCCLLGKVLVWSEAMDAEGEKLKLWYCPNHTLDWTNVLRNGPLCKITIIRSFSTLGNSSSRRQRPIDSTYPSQELRKWKGTADYYVRLIQQNGRCNSPCLPRKYFCGSRKKGNACVLKSFFARKRSSQINTCFVRA